MKRKMKLPATAILLLLSCTHPSILAQTSEIQKFEIGAQFSSLSIDQGGGNRTEPGFGARLTYNVTDSFALEAEGNFFPDDESFALRTGGRGVEGLFGVKLGKRYKRFGFFGKARPGFITFSRGFTEVIPTGVTTDPFTAFDFRTRRLTHFAFDAGRVVELSPSRRIFTRIDIGDTIIHFGRTTITSFTGLAGGPFTPVLFTLPSRTTHNFQFSAGVGFRF